MDAETGEEYLTKMNFRSLVEWITAETLLARPDDPMAYARTLLEKKMDMREAGEKYFPDQVTGYIKSCYADASASADEHGRIPTRNEAFQNSIGKSSNKRLDLLEKLIAASRAIAMQLDPFEATKSIIQETCRILDADRATLFSYDMTTEELVLNVAEGAENIRVPFGKGIAGTVAATGKCINIEDVYTDPRFDSHYDQQTGYKTKTLLCAPVYNGEGQIVGVMQVINPLSGGPFTDVDEEVMGILAAQAGIAVHNSMVHRMAVQTKEKVKSLLDIVHAMHGDLGINSLMFTVTQRVRMLVDSDRCTFFLIDKTKNELWSIQGEMNIRIPVTQGIAGVVAQTGDTVNIKNAYEDPRFSQKVDQQSGYKTRTILAMALRNHSQDVIGVLQLINKTSGYFDKEDEELLQAFLHIAGPIMENSQLFARSKDDSNGGNEYTGKMQQRQNHDAAEMNKIEEDEEEEET